MTGYRQKRKDLDLEFNKWLDGVDIRRAGMLIDKCKELKVNLPKWIANKSFVIDYNNNGTLDLIRINQAD